MKTTTARRTFLGGVAAATSLSLGFVRKLLAAEPPPPPTLPGTAGVPVRWGMVIDLDKCDGCGACAVACRNENNVAVAGPEQTEKDRGMFWMDLLHLEGESHQDLRLAGKVESRSAMKLQVIPTPCNHCENAPCVKVCPVGATYFNEEGIVAQMWARCIGCRFCTVACPYTRRYFNWFAPKFSEEQKERLNPSVSTRPVGVVEKCTFCHHRIRKVREEAKAAKRPIKDEEVRNLPACSQSCPAGAITFGDLNDSNAEVTKLAAGERSFRLQEELGTHPKVVYLRRERW